MILSFRLEWRSAAEHGVDGERVVHCGHAQDVPGKAEVGPVDADLGVQPDLAVQSAIVDQPPQARRRSRVLTVYA